MEFMGIVFTISYLKNFSRMMCWWREVAATSNNQTQHFSSCKWKKNRAADQTPSEANSLPKLFYAFKTFALNEYDLRILSSVFLMEIFNLPEKGLKYAKGLLLNHYRKSMQNYMRLQDMRGRS